MLADIPIKGDAEQLIDQLSDEIERYTDSIPPQWREQLVAMLELKLKYLKGTDGGRL